ncbi:type VI secretion system tube protein Hcp [Neobacillus mesonae]|uniref:type VI secretion system tube protein Hcp n=1 Tax=Neobacillus mesonae TaxID=1193713 RepID=UPI00203C9B33|nr:type VI secretion system tube protein Hcp [Neobacillus mesonae]MCM3568119.1 type VI secretion system tube protein Hcp [Neobacillus mesonae]
MGIIYPTTLMSIVIERSSPNPDLTFDISSYSIGFSNPPPDEGGGGGGASKVEAGDLFVQKELDIGSIPLFDAVIRGTHFPSLTLTVTQNSITILTIILEDVTVTGFDQTGSGAGVTEEVKFHYEVITMETDAFGLSQSSTFDRNA